MAVEGAPAARVEWIDAARGISIVLIVMLHARIVLSGVGVRSEILAQIDDVAGHLRLPLFFAASGLLAARWASARWPELVRGRLTPLIWVFLVWQPVVLAYKLAEWWLLRDDLDDRWAWQLGQALLSPVRPVGELWFLWALCVFLVLSRATARWPTWLRLGIPALASFSWMAFVEPVLGGEIAELLGAGPGGVVKYYVFFVAAATFATSLRSVVSATPRWVAALAVVVWAVGTHALLDSGLDVRWVRFALFATGAVAGLALGRVLDRVTPVRALGRRTLPIYVAHLAIIVAVVIVLHALDAISLLTPVAALTVVAVAALAIGGSLLLHRVLSGTRAGRLLYEPPAARRGSRPRMSTPRAPRRSRVGP
jgi:uncharacterized membrane protein YcfT